MRQNRDARELEILDRAKELVEEKGFFSMKLSELAQRSVLSMGTLYSHFSCKEDVLFGLAIQAAEQRYQYLQREIVGKKPLETFIVSALACMRFSFENRALCEASLLAKSPSVWGRASDRMHDRLHAAEEKLGEVFPGTLLGDMVGDENIDSYRMGAWSLSLGMDVVSFSSYTHHSEQREAWEQLYKNNLICFLKGWGWRENNPTKVIEQLSENDSV